jgi:hypothetical protein
MFRRLLLLSSLLILLLRQYASAQVADAATAVKSEVEKPSRDIVMLQFTYDGWSKDDDTIKTKGFGRGFNAYLNYDFPIKKSNFSFSAGIGIGTSNIFLDDQEVRLTDTGVAASRIAFVPEGTNYKKYKITTAYVEAPFELRYFGNKENRNKGFKAAIGLRAGMLVGAKAKGNTSVDGNKVVEKLNTRRYFEKWRVSATVRIGWGNFSLFGAYNLNNVFKDGEGPKATPYSIGLAISGL